MHQLLTSEGYVTFTAMSGEDGWDKLNILSACGEHPWLIILDLMLPKMDGREFLRRMLADPRLKTIPVMVVSGKQDIDCGVPYIRKPFDVDEFLNMVSGLIVKSPQPVASKIS